MVKKPTPKHETGCHGGRVAARHDNTYSRVKTESLTDLMRSSAAQSPLTHGLLLVNVLVFLLMLGKGASFWHGSSGIQLAWGANFGPATQDGQWWGLLTATFIHFGFWHLAMNMWALRDVGRLLERLMGTWRFATIYLGAGVLGNLLSLVVQGNQAVSGGASGAIFGLYGALMVFLWRERRQVDPAEFRWLFGAASVFTLLMLGLGWVLPGIDNAAHGGGLIAGGLLGRVLAHPWTARSPSQQVGQWLALAGLGLGMVGLVTHLPAPKYLFGEELKAREVIQNYTLADQRVIQQWQHIFNQAPRQGQSFEQLAGLVEASVSTDYQHSFEQLMATSTDPQAPSAEMLEDLQSYAQQRLQTANELASSLRAHDVAKVREVLRQSPTRHPAASSTAR